MVSGPCCHAGTVVVVNVAEKGRYAEVSLVVLTHARTRREGNGAHAAVARLLVALEVGLRRWTCATRTCRLDGCTVYRQTGQNGGSRVRRRGGARNTPDVLVHPAVRQGCVLREYAQDRVAVV